MSTQTPPGEPADPRLSESSVRDGLRSLEGNVRRLALLALASFHDLGIVETCLFPSLASLQRPSWGTWNGLLQTLKKARRLAARRATREERERLEAAEVLNRILTRLAEPIPGGRVEPLQPLASFTRGSIRKKTTVGQVLALPISIRNRLAHDTPSDPAWFRTASEVLDELEEFLDETRPFAEEPEGGIHPSPWFLETANGIHAFNGIDRDGTVHYVSVDGARIDDTTRTHEILQCLQRLMGKTELQEGNFQKLLGKLAPEEIRGVILGDYLVGPEAGEGGFATVHRGRQLSTQRPVAIKILRDGLSEEVRARFQQEAAYLSRLDHPHIVSVIGYGEETWSVPRSIRLSEEEWYRKTFHNASPRKSFIVMEWVEGRSLDDHVTAGTEVDPVEATRWFAQAASALAAVHAAGLIHRDVKPANLMITAATGVDPGGEVRLMDFGIARCHHEARTLVTEAGTVFGTPAYMSPEQIRSARADEDVGPATDIYSLAATFYEVYTGHRCFGHDTSTLEMVTSKKLGGIRPDRPRLLARGLPWEVETILLGGLEAEPRDRYESMTALERDLRHSLHHEPIEYRRPSLLRRVALGYRRNRTIVHLAAAFGLVLIVGLVAYVLQIKSEQRRTARERDEKDRQRRVASTRLVESLVRQEEIPLAISLLGREIDGTSVIAPEQERWFRYWYPALRDVGAGMDAPIGAIAFRWRGRLYLRQDARPPRLLPDPNARLFAVDADENRLILVSDAAAVTILALDTLDVVSRYEIERHEVEQISFPEDASEVVFHAKLLEYAGAAPIVHVLRVPYGESPEADPEEEIGYYDFPESGSMEMKPWPLTFPDLVDEATLWREIEPSAAGDVEWIAGDEHPADAFGPEDPSEIEEFGLAQVPLASCRRDRHRYLATMTLGGRFPDRYLWKIDEGDRVTDLLLLPSLDGESPRPSFQGRFLFQPVLTHHDGRQPFALIDLESFRPLLPDRVPTWVPTELEAPTIHEEDLGTPPLSRTAAIAPGGDRLALLGDAEDVWIYEVSTGTSRLTRRLVLNEGSLLRRERVGFESNRYRGPVVLVFAGDGRLLVGLGDGTLVAVRADTGEIEWRRDVGLLDAFQELIVTSDGGVCITRTGREIALVDPRCGIPLSRPFLIPGAETPIALVGTEPDGALVVQLADRTLWRRLPPLPAAAIRRSLADLSRKTGLVGEEGTTPTRDLLGLLRLGR